MELIRTSTFMSSSLPNCPNAKDRPFWHILSVLDTPQPQIHFVLQPRLSNTHQEHNFDYALTEWMGMMVVMIELSL